MLIKSTVLALFGALALSVSAYAGEYDKKASKTAAGDAQTKAVLIYADWCGSCRILDPRIKAVKESGQFEDVAFVTLDYTARDEKAFYKAAKEAGVKKAVRSAFDGTSIKTGQMFLISADGTEILDTITRNHSETEIAEAIAAAQTARI